jgi:hypothetical protein
MSSDGILFGLTNEIASLFLKSVAEIGLTVSSEEGEQNADGPGA